MMSVDARSAQFAVATATTAAIGVTTAAGTTATGATGAITTTTGDATSRPSSRSRRRQQPAAAFQRPVADYPLRRIKSNQIKSNMTLIMVDKPQPSYNLLNVMK